MGTRYNRLDEAVLTNTHNLCFELKYEKCQHFYLKTFRLFLFCFFLFFLGFFFFFFFVCFFCGELFNIFE